MMQIPLWHIVFTLGFSLSAIQGDNITCGPPPFIEFASVTNPVLEEYPVGASVTYSCEFGYIPDSNSRASQCIAAGREGEWTDLQMSCIPRSCGDPGYVANGHRIGSLFSFPNSVIFECDDGYKIRGNAKRYCQASGSWSGRLPRCEAIYCDQPQQPKNGRATYTSLEYGSELQYECKKGFKPENNNPTVCTDEGVWSQTIDCVEITCEVPEVPEHGSVDLLNSGERPRAGSIAVFSCEENRIPDGATTVKCLDIGQWTFAPPKCLEPCAIPFVPNGKIGRYVSRRYSSTMDWNEIPVGTELEDNEKLFLHCRKGYDPMGSDNWQAKVVCNKGKWLEEPYCEPASCRSNPPSVDNSDVIEDNSKHGSSVRYECLPDFKMVKDGNVTCTFGEWTGTIPICKDTRCYLNQLNFNGLKTGSYIYYRNGESFEIECKSGYEVSKKRKPIMKCEDGSWNGPMPPCTAASCLSPPPKITHGRIVSSSSTHSSIVKYVCDETYILTGGNQVQCLFGEWKGDPPTCKDSRCSFNDLNHRTGMSLETESFTSSGSELNVRCDTGYTLKGIKPLCVNTVWTRNTKSPCEESDCVVDIIAHGDLQIQKLGKSYFNWKSFRFVRDPFYENIPTGRIMKHGSSAYLECYGRFTFQGTGYGRALISCSKGRWEPDPVCLVTGMKYHPTTAAPKTTTSAVSKQQDVLTPERTIISKPSTVRDRAAATTAATEDHLDRNPMVETFDVQTGDFSNNNECVCEVTVDDENLVSFVDDRQLKIHDRVKNGSVVKFRCKDVGFQRLAGPTEIVCQNCRPWHSSEFPTCLQPQRGDAVIVHDDKVNVTINGTLEILKGEDIQLICIAIEEAKYPTWTVPSISRTKIMEQRVDRGTDILYVTFLDIERPEFEDEGWYTCAVGSSRSTAVHVAVIDHTIRCQKFIEEEEEFIIEYDEETRVKSKAIFSCRKYDRQLVGNNVLTCLSNGQWSDLPPQCKNITCRALNETDLMKISYTDDQNIGSFASFHCFAPGQRFGVSRTRCLENGEWADPIPICETPPCSVEDLFSKLPQKVEPDMDDINKEVMPYNSSARLTCTEGLTLIGDPLAKCGKEGEWEIGSMHCILGCGAIPKRPGSNLIITPERDTYRIGHSVTFQCPPGKELNIELEMIMCLSSGWSETILPECEDITDDDSH